MRPLERALDALRQVPGEPRGGHGLPAECYRDPEYAALESERVLRPAKVMVSKAPEPEADETCIEDEEAEASESDQES